MLFVQSIILQYGRIMYNYRLVDRKTRRKNPDYEFKATPHRTCAEDAPTDFSSDCIEIPQAY
jgi:hypothetical protein